MEGRWIAPSPTKDGSAERITEARSRRRRATLNRRLRRLAVPIIPVIATVLVAAPASAWPEIGG